MQEEIEWDAVVRAVCGKLTAVVENRQTMRVEEYDDNEYSFFTRDFADITLQFAGLSYTFKEQKLIDWLVVDGAQEEDLVNDFARLAQNSEYALTFSANPKAFLQSFYSQFLHCAYVEYTKEYESDNC